MAEIKLTKNELRAQQKKLSQLQRYLPTLQLKKAMLQTEVNEARAEILKLQKEADRVRQGVEAFSSLLEDKVYLDAKAATKIQKVHKHYENVAGVDIPYYEGVDYEPLEYGLYESPPWVDSAVASLRSLVEAEVRVQVGEEKKRALEKELREVSIRVNLFEKILIPRSRANIKKIKVFLGDQELAAVSQAKSAKNKIEARKKEAQETAYAS